MMKGEFYLFPKRILGDIKRIGVGLFEGGCGNGGKLLSSRRRRNYLGSQTESIMTTMALYGRDARQSLCQHY